MATNRSLGSYNVKQHDSIFLPIMRDVYFFRRPDDELEDRPPIVPFGSESKCYQLQLPDRLVIRKDKTWSITQNETIISQTPYLYVSYLKNQIEDWIAFESNITTACEENALEAYWLDSDCQSQDIHSSDRRKDLAKMGDIIRGASKILVVIGTGINIPRSLQWLEWASRFWTLPELVFGRDITYKFLRGGLVDIDSRQMCRLLFNWEDQDIRTKLVYIYSELLSSGGSSRPELTELQPIDLVVPLIQAIWDEDIKHPSFPDLPTEKIHVLMAFLPAKVDISDNVVSEDEAFDAVIAANSWETHGLSRHSRMPHSLSKAFEKLTVPPDLFLDRTEMAYPSMFFYYRHSEEAWFMSRNLDTLASYEYLAVFYRQPPIADFETAITQLDKLRLTVGSICRNNFVEMDAYWFSYTCLSAFPAQADVDIYRMANVFLRAATTLILRTDPNSVEYVSEDVAWKTWGENIWSFPEILLSSSLCYCSMYNLLESISRMDAFTKAYGTDERYDWLVNYFEHNKSMDDENSWPCLMSAIWGKKNGIGEKLIAQKSSEGPQYLPDFKAERIYVFMALLPVRIFPNRGETEKEALIRLLKANGKDVANFRRILQQWCDKNLTGEDNHYLELRSILNDNLDIANLN